MQMKKKTYFLLISFLFLSFHAMPQSGMCKADSTLLKKKLVFQQSVSKDASTYQMPSNPAGFSLQLAGSDNLSVITKEGKIYTPLNDLTVNLFLKITKDADNSTIEWNVPVQVQGKYPNKGVNPKPFVILHIPEHTHPLSNSIILVSD